MFLRSQAQIKKQMRAHKCGQELGNLCHLDNTDLFYATLGSHDTLRREEELRALYNIC
jgi:hypothetical protein